MNEKTEPTTAELKRHLETIYEQNEYGIQNIIVGDSRYVQEVCGDALEVIEQQEQRIAELERELKLREPMKPSALRKERDAAIYGACELRKEMIGLRRALAAVKEDLHHNDACSVCIGADQEVCKDCDLECQTCVLDCRCKDCRDESKWEWRGAREGEGK